MRRFSSFEIYFVMGVERLGPSFKVQAPYFLFFFQSSPVICCADSYFNEKHEEVSKMSKKKQLVSFASSVHFYFCL